MKEKDGPYEIGEIKFLDVTIKIYFDKYQDKSTFMISWQARNPDSCYQGIMYQNNITGKLTYPDDAIIPEQSSKDREYLPRFIIVGSLNYTEHSKEIHNRLSQQHKLRNQHIWTELNYDW